MDTQNLQTLENKLQNFLETEKHNWTKTAQVLIEIERRALFKEKARSFTQYVRQLAEQFQIHESNFWRIRKAGEYYLKLNDTTDIEVIGQAKTTPEQIEILTKISTIAPPDVVKGIEKKMIAGETTRQELRDVWKAYRPAKEGKNERGGKFKKPLPSNLGDSDDPDDPDANTLPLPFSPISPISPISPTSPTSPTLPMPPVLPIFLKPPRSPSAQAAQAITAANIVTALKDTQWAIETVKQKQIDHFHLFKEVAVTAGSSRYARRIDVVAIVRETYKSLLPTVIGVEIKTSVNDLLRDMKLTEYMSFCHYFYLAIPNDPAFIDAAESVTTRQIGLLCITDEVIDGRYQIVVNRKARRLQPHPAILGELYGRCLFHALGWIGKEEDGK
jgi:hypothetical protein